MNTYILLFIIISLLLFLFAPINVKFLISFVVMSNFFDLVPSKLMVSSQLVSIKLWDFGLIFLLISAIHVYAYHKNNAPHKGVYLKFYWLFIAWLIFSFIWSISIYRYPVLDTIKCSRSMVLGYLTYYVFLKMLEYREDSLKFILKSLYVIVWLLSIIQIIQFATGFPLFRGYVREYSGVIRSIPNFLPLVFLFYWHNMTRLLSGEKTSLLDKSYIVLSVFVTLTTFTRGIYLSFLFVNLAGGLLLAFQQKLKITRLMLIAFLSILSLLLIIPTGKMDKFIKRAQSGIELTLNYNNVPQRKNDDNFTGRIGLLKERMNMVAEKNFLIGYGFIHEKLATTTLHYRFGGLSREGGTKLAFASGDIAWANMFIYTGYLGALLFVCFILSLVGNFLNNSSKITQEYFSLRFAFFLQTILLVILMLDGAIFTQADPIPFFILAGYTYCSGKIFHTNQGTKHICL